MFLCDTPKEVGSFLLLNSEYIQRYVPLFVDLMRKGQEEYRQIFLEEEMKKENDFRSYFRWLGIKPLSLDLVKEKIDFLREHGSVSQMIRYSMYYPWDCKPERVSIANRLLAMSRREKRVFVSADDFDAVFRGDISNEITKKLKEETRNLNE